MEKRHSLLVEDKSDGVGEGVILLHDGESRRARIRHRTMLHGRLPRIDGHGEGISGSGRCRRPKPGVRSGGGGGVAGRQFFLW